LPLFLEPVDLAGGYWCDGGIVDIFSVHPVLDLDPCDAVVAVNAFYPPSFEGEDQTGWQDRILSIIDIASQVRTCQHVALARENLARLRRETNLLMLEPVPYRKVAGIGFYRQFIDTTEWPAFMDAGHAAARRALLAWQRPVSHAVATVS
jgi:NTE family protein